MTPSDAQPVPPSELVQRRAQAWISRIAADTGDDLAPETPTPGRRIEPEPLVVIPFGAHTDHQRLLLDTGEEAEVRLRVIEHALVSSSPLIRARMHTDQDTVAMLEQHATLDDEPLFVRVSYHLSSDLDPISRAWRAHVPGADVGTMGDLFRRLFGRELARTESSVEAVRSDARTALSLRVPVGSPMILREMVLTADDGVVRELSFTHFRADRVALLAD
ncbi:UTRA domain-containing protein [Frondihabitans sp. PhB188]|uniref:UTRA domain-containing protein n=1 Tax=Frondihabitans sp. PhB188 TaxID=2485200 RepID=UPI000F49B31A|nr:UTRA domain-containing protein [Frondihabitans sp. PhB188]ROQ39707.1 UTRA domain-containing protein [Frondihabitans sp. PhB188]